MGWIAWLIIGIVLGIIEMLTLEFTFLMFAGAALAAAVAAGLTPNLAIQVAVFCIVAVILLFTVRPWARRHIENSSPDSRTNVDSLPGQIAEALSDVTARGGRVKLDGEVWSARTFGAPIPEGSIVTVARIDGAHAIVEPR